MNLFRRAFPVLLFFIIALQSSFSYAQNKERDSLELHYGIVLCDTTFELADSVLNALRTRKFQSLTPYIASAEFLKMTLDSLDTTNMLKMARIRYNFNVNEIRKDHIRLQKYLKRHKLNIKKLEFEDKLIRIHKRESGPQYAEIFLIFKKKDQRYAISFLAVELFGYWFIYNQLELQVLI